tara:strand:+ start:869 stop:2479 length:1611 start_codon:yes stop_codon:yes gene_type:complete
MTINTASSASKLKNKPIIWTISGADCSGGAGIAADIKTAHNLKVEICHLITANTVQNSTRLLAINPVNVSILAEQSQALRFDKAPSVIKIGLIANRGQISWLVVMLSALKQQLPHLLIVYDPVGQASVGGGLSTLTTADLTPLMPLLDVITPNLIEAKQLTPLSAKSQGDNMHNMAENILQLGCKAVIIKGGHADTKTSLETASTCTDICLQGFSATSQQLFTLQSPKINTSYSHGGGCSFASALACFLAHGYLLRDAFTLTKAFINQGLSLSAELSSDENDSEANFDQENNGKNKDYYGAFQQSSWPKKSRYFPSVISPYIQQIQSSADFLSLNLTEGEKLGLYPVIDSLSWLERLLPLNLKIIQLRIKHKKPAELAAIIKKAVAMARDYKCRLFINDHWQLAIKFGAYGVHIGQEDLASADLSAIAKAGLRLGISTHGCYEFLLAKQLQPSYLAIGAIFATKTKDMTGQIQGLANLRQIITLAETIPIVAIGGINQQRLERVWRTGVNAVAVVTAITAADHPIIATKTLQAMLT